MTRRVALALLAATALALCGCSGRRPPRTVPSPVARRGRAKRPPLTTPPLPATRPAREPRDYRVVHVFVALCDNAHQGIVPVSAALGDGQNPRTNLYWGAMYGVKTFLRKASGWQGAEVRCAPQRPEILDRAAFRRGDLVLIAEAYDGRHMATALSDFLLAASGRHRIAIGVERGGVTVTVETGGAADMVCFVGHNGLMEHELNKLPAPADAPRPRCAVVLACKSDAYFSKPLRQVGCLPLITTTGLMAPEAYTLEAIVRTWADDGGATAVRSAAAAAYARYQRCSLPAAMRLFHAGTPRPSGP